MSILFSLFFKSFKYLVALFSIFCYLCYIVVLTIELTKIDLTNDVIGYFKIFFYSFFLIYFTVLFCFQKIYYQNTFLKSVIFASFINSLIITVSFFISFLLVFNGYASELVTFNKAQALMSLFNLADEIEKDILNLSANEKLKYKEVFLYAIVTMTNIFVISSIKIYLIVRRLMKLRK